MAEVDGMTGADGSVGAEAPETAGPTPSIVAAHIEALNLTGLAFAVRRLLGKDPLPVTNQFTMWARQDSKGLPGVTHAYWSALAPLRIGRPQSPAAAVCDQVLRGRERDGTVALNVARDCADTGKARFTPLREAAGEESVDAQRRKALVKAVKDYWRIVGTMYGEIRTPVTEGDLGAAVERMRRAEPALREVIEQVAALAIGVAGQHVQDDVEAEAAAPESVLAAHAEGQAEPGPAMQGHEGQGYAEDQAYVEEGHVQEGYEEEGYEEEEAPPRRRPGDPDPVMARAEAFAHKRQLREDPTPEPRPVEVLSTKPVRNHIFLPIVFGLLVTGLALYVIFAVLNAPNPLR